VAMGANNIVAVIFVLGTLVGATAPPVKRVK
jgi:hypothetical protein